jgi:hypothetical protein
MRVDGLHEGELVDFSLSVASQVIDKPCDIGFMLVNGWKGGKRLEKPLVYRHGLLLSPVLEGIPPLKISCGARRFRDDER